MKLPLLVTVIMGFALGVGIGTTLPVVDEVILLLLVISVGIGLVRRKNSQGIFTTHLLLLGVFLATVAVGLWRVELAQPDISTLATAVGETVELLGVVSREPDKRELMQLLYVDTEGGRVLVSTDRHVDVAYGDQVNMAGVLQVPIAFTTDLGREFDYPGYLQARGVYYQISFAKVAVVSSGNGNFILASLSAVKQKFTTALEKALPEPYVGLGEGLLLGEKRALGETISEQFRRTGLTHIVVLSGYNVMLVVTFCLFVFSFLFAIRGRIIAGIIAIVLFALLVGLSATVVRASIMAVMVLLAQATGRRYDVLRALLIAATIMLLVNPYLLLYDIGFQLSFMATLGLVLYAPDFESTAATKGVTTLRGFLVATVVTQIAVLPLLVYHIGQVSIIAVVANILVLPVVAPAMLLTFCVGVISLLSPAAALPITFLAQLNLSYILLVTEWLARLPFAAIVTPEIAPTVVFVWYGMYAVGYWWWLYGRKSVAFSPIQTKNSISHWEIIEESELHIENKKTRQTSSAASSEDTPVFFR